MPASKSRKPALPMGLMDAVVGYHIAKARVTTHALFLHHIGQPYALRPVEYTLLLLLQASQGLTPKQLSRALALSGPNLTILLDRMQERGFIERVRSEVDRRSQQIMLTPTGQSFTAELAERTPEMESELDQVLSPAERAMLIELLGKVANHRSVGGEEH